MRIPSLKALAALAIANDPVLLTKTENYVDRDSYDFLWIIKNHGIEKVPSLKALATSAMRANIASNNPALSNAFYRSSKEVIIEDRIKNIAAYFEHPHFINEVALDLLNLQPLKKEEKQSLLISALNTRRTKIIEALKMMEADDNIPVVETTMKEELVSMGASIDIQQDNADRLTPLCMAVYNGHNTLRTLTEK